MAKRDTEFKFEEYEEFYSDHHFQEIPEEFAIRADRLIPRVAWANDVAEELQPKSLLDLGCLDGFASLTLANNVLSIETTVGVDLSERGINLATERAAKHNLKATYIQSTIEDFLETTDQKFDLIMLFEVIEHVKDPPKLLELIDRVKTKDGQVLVSTPDFEGPRFGKDDEQNKCHIRLYTTAAEDYEAVNKYGNTRKATSITREIGEERIIELDVINELINVRYS